jgi:adenosylcobyric acid synthase
LNVETVLTPNKTVRPVTARHEPSGLDLAAYEIHLGHTGGPDGARAPFSIGDQPEGAISADGRIMGTYLHGLFTSDAFRQAFLRALHPGIAFDGLNYESEVEGTLDALADHLETHLDADRILAIAREGL